MPTVHQPANLPILLSQRNEEKPVTDFLAWVRRKSVVGVVGPSSSATPQGRRFIPLPYLQDYFKEDQYQRLLDVLDSLFPYGVPTEVTPGKILNQYIQSFAIILCIGEGPFIAHFVRYDSLRDRKLPHETCPPNFPPVPRLEDTFFEKFRDKQWMFCIPTLEYELGKEHAEEIILPIIEKEHIGGGGSANAYKIELHPEYNSLHSKEDLQQGSERTHVFVLKTYGHHRADQKHHKNEVNSFVRLRDKRRALPSLITFYGSFVYHGSTHILLEYANRGTLQNYFQTESPPAKGEHVIEFWSRLLLLIDALHRLHEVKHGEIGNAQVMQGFEGPIYLVAKAKAKMNSWHQDVNPTNILMCQKPGSGRYECDFKLADFGLSRFREKLGEEDAVVIANNGTKKYGAPECCPKNAYDDQSSLPITSKVDIWSLGCVFSEAATWVVWGFDGIKDYEDDRSVVHDQMLNFRYRGCFHDGEEVLEVVTKHHQNISNSEDRRPSDFTTPKVLDLVDAMLFDENVRVNAAYCHKRAERILSQGSISSPSSKSHRYSATHVLGQSNADAEQDQPYIFGPPIRNIVSARQGALQQSIDSPVARSSTIPGYGGISNVAGRSDDVFVDMPNNDTGEFIDRELHGSPDQLPLRPTTSPDSLDQRATSSQTEAQEVPRNASLLNQRVVGTTTILNSASEKIPLPFLAIESANKWMSDRKKGIAHARLTDDHLQLELNKRDHVFLLDDSMSMYDHWADATRLLELLAFMVKRADPDGLDLYFAGSDDHKKTKNESELAKYAMLSRPKKDRTRRLNIYTRLSFILDNYEKGLRNPPRNWYLLHKALRPLNLYIFTDGEWQPKSDAVTPIISLIKTLDELGKPLNQFGIQFIRFGDSTLGKQRLQYLDARIKEAFGLTRDIVDTEPSNGNVWKMLLGAINRWIDEDEHTAPGDPEEWKRLFGVDVPRFAPIFGSP